MSHLVGLPSIGVTMELIRVTSHPSLATQLYKMQCKCLQNSPKCTKVNVRFKNLGEPAPTIPRPCNGFCLSALIFFYHQYLVRPTFLLRSPLFSKASDAHTLYNQVTTNSKNCTFRFEVKCYHGQDGPTRLKRTKQESKKMD